MAFMMSRIVYMDDDRIFIYFFIGCKIYDLVHEVLLIRAVMYMTIMQELIGCALN